MEVIKRILEAIVLVCIVVHCNCLNNEDEPQRDTREKPKNVPFNRRFYELMLSKYDESQRPNHGGAPLEVTIQVRPQEVRLDPREMTMSVDMYVHQSWTDDRLQATSQYGDAVAYVNNRYKDRIWTPSMFIANRIKVERPDSLYDGKSLQLATDGSVSYAQRFTSKTSCEGLWDYMKTFNCSVDVQLYDTASADVKLAWDSNHASYRTIDPEILWFQGIALKPKLIMESREESLSTGNYQELTIVFQFERTKAKGRRMF